MSAHDGDLWVFGYGSLIWRPGFAYLERLPATLHGFHRSLCVYSHVHRGTPERPGLVLGLDKGGSCRGVAFRVAAAEASGVLAYLREREQVTMVYKEIAHRLRLADGRQATGRAYVVDPRHPQYAGRLERERMLDIVRHGRGLSGANPDYVLNTDAHLRMLGIRDAVLAWLAAELAGRPQAEAEKCETERFSPERS
jgi:glutathione-specific gamma-glutamylcyclotransferase